MQKLASLLNMNARNPLVIQMQKKTGHPPLLTEFLLLLAVQNVPFLHNYETLVFIHKQRITPFLTMSSRPVRSIDCFTAFLSSPFFLNQNLIQPLSRLPF